MEGTVNNPRSSLGSGSGFGTGSGSGFGAQPSILSDLLPARPYAALQVHTEPQAAHRTLTQGLGTTAFESLEVRPSPETFDEMPSMEPEPSPEPEPGCADSVWYPNDEGAGSSYPCTSDYTRFCTSSSYGIYIQAGCPILCSVAHCFL